MQSYKKYFLFPCFIFSLVVSGQTTYPSLQQLKSGFSNPPDSCRPGVYWYFMDGNISEEGIVKDLRSMREAGIGHVVFLEVNVGIPRGKIDFLSNEWLRLFNLIVSQAKKEGIDITLGIGPGWAGSGGPWVQPDQSMQHLVSSSINVTGPGLISEKLKLPRPKVPFFGEASLTPSLKEKRDSYYRDVAVLAFPTPGRPSRMDDIENKALYYRSPFSSVKNVKRYYQPLLKPDAIDNRGVIKKTGIVDISDRLNPDGSLRWELPNGKWTIMRFGARNNGAVTRPAPVPGLGFEIDKFDTTALNAHLYNYVGRILTSTGRPDSNVPGGLKNLHMDSWEMGAQNWTNDFRSQFLKRRGYDPMPYYPVYAGMVVSSPEVSDRFLWDLRMTSQELVVEHHALHVKDYAYLAGMKLSIEPYDMNPTADLELGAVADIPMCEFWSRGYGYNTQFSCYEATSLGHIQGKKVVAAESFTAENNEAWKQYPGSMKNQGDWALALGINKFFYHTFQHQNLPDSLKPGMTMGPYGVQWNRNQTWWPMAGGYHKYITSCSYLLQQGNAVADILYLTPEEAPYVFMPPKSATTGDAMLRDKKGFSFDACPPSQLYFTKVSNRKIVFPTGASYEILVLPDYPAMTVPLLKKITELINDGATVLGGPVKRGKGLAGYPQTEMTIKSLVKELWGPLLTAQTITKRNYGKGKLIWGGELQNKMDENYPVYEVIEKILEQQKVRKDFMADRPIRYQHRSVGDIDLYFVSNTLDTAFQTNCRFRSTKKNIELWDPLTNSMRKLHDYIAEPGSISLPLYFERHQSFFIVFSNSANEALRKEPNILKLQVIDSIKGPWVVCFDSMWGGPSLIKFEKLTDWINHENPGIKYYSGIAKYQKTFSISGTIDLKKKLWLDVGVVKNMARIKLNGKDLGVLWTEPWAIEISKLIRPGDNDLEIEVANLWPNRLIGDAAYTGDGIKNGEWPEWILNRKPRPSQSYSFTTHNPYTTGTSLFSSGLLGPVTLKQQKY